MNILTIFGSSRRNGNSEILTEHMLKDIPYTKIHLLNQHIVPFEDKRHSSEGFPIVEDDFEDILQSLFSHDVYVFSTPLYWYGMSGQMKLFFDRWSQYLRDERFNFKAEMSKKKAYLVITGGGNPKIVGLPLVQQFKYIFDFVNMEFVDYIIGEGNAPGDILRDESSLKKALYLNESLKKQLDS
ncbi:flavodoxin family protein [Bacillus spongiae]|uniref:Flavodoxin family protein n=1 Tax=Bacillus spongiae TaxID=2683610 RepID=A0ABU8HAE4_9BACI